MVFRGRWKKYLSNPKVSDGSVITVQKAEETEPFDITEFSRDIASILSDFAQVIAMVILSRN